MLKMKDSHLSLFSRKTSRTKSWKVIQKKKKVRRKEINVLTNKLYKKSSVIKTRSTRFGILKNKNYPFIIEKDPARLCSFLAAGMTEKVFVGPLRTPSCHLPV